MIQDTVIKILSNETLLKSLNDSGYVIDWEVVKEYFGALLKPATQEPQKFDPADKSMGFGLTDTVTSSLRGDIERLRRDARIADPTLSSLLSRLIDIVDRLEQRPPSIQFTPMPNPVIFPTIAPQPWQPVPNSFPTKPYIGDPPGFPGSGTICSSETQTHQNQSVSDATGVSEPMLSDEEIPF